MLADTKLSIHHNNRFSWNAAGPALQRHMWVPAPVAYDTAADKTCNSTALGTKNVPPATPYHQAYLPDILKLQLLNGRCLELQQAALCGVAVHADDMAGTVQQQVEAVAASRGQRQHGVVAVDVHHLQPQEQSSHTQGWTEVSVPVRRAGWCSLELRV